jgi:hypothetical protein
MTIAKVEKIAAVSIFMRQKGVQAKNDPMLRSIRCWAFLPAGALIRPADS